MRVVYWIFGLENQVTFSRDEKEKALAFCNSLLQNDVRFSVDYF